MDVSVVLLINFFLVYPVLYLPSNLFLSFIPTRPAMILNVLFLVIIAIGIIASSAYVQKYLGKIICRLYVATAVALALTMQIWLPYHDEWMPAYILSLSDLNCRNSVEPACIVEWVAIKPDLSCCSNIAVVRRRHVETGDQTDFKRDLNHALERKKISEPATSIDTMYTLFSGYAVVIYTSG